MKISSLIAVASGALFLAGTTAGASVYMMEKKPDEKPVKVFTAYIPAPKILTYSDAQPPPFPVCDDGNSAGEVVNGAVGRSLSGEEDIPAKNIACN